MKGIIDRIEGDLAVCEMEGKRMENIPLSAFQKAPREGDAFTYENGTILLLPEETARKKEQVQSLFDRLKKK